MLILLITREGPGCSPDGNVCKYKTERFLHEVA
jgi:hypothetical protein